MDENLTTGQKVKLMFKEMKIGFFNGAILAVMALVFLGAYIHLFKGFTLGYSLMIFRLCGRVPGGRHGGIQPGGNPDPDFLQKGGPWTRQWRPVP